MCSTYRGMKTEFIRFPENAPVSILSTFLPWIFSGMATLTALPLYALMTANVSVNSHVNKLSGSTVFQRQ